MTEPDQPAPDFEEALDLANAESGIKGCDAVWPYDQFSAYFGMKRWAEALLREREAREEGDPAKDAAIIAQRIRALSDGGATEQDALAALTRLLHAALPATESAQADLSPTERAEASGE